MTLGTDPEAWALILCPGHESYALGNNLCPGYELCDPRTNTLPQAWILCLGMDSLPQERTLWPCVFSQDAILADQGAISAGTDAILAGQGAVSCGGPERHHG